MSPTDTKKRAGKLRGFTLIEMLVVIAIIAILAGMMSIAIGGFQRDARMETDNDKARLAYTGFQNAIMRCEITQDDLVLNAAKLLVDGGHSDANSNKRLTYTIVRFNMRDGAISGNIRINSFYENSSSIQSSISMPRGSKQFSKVEDVILSNFDNSFDGFVAVYIDADNYVVDSALYFENESDYTDNESSGWVSVLSQYAYVSDGISGSSQGKVFQTLESTSEQKTLIKNKGIYCGAYPLMDQTSQSYAKAS